MKIDIKDVLVNIEIFFNRKINLSNSDLQLEIRSKIQNVRSSLEHKNIDQLRSASMSLVGLALELTNRGTEIE